LQDELSSRETIGGDGGHRIAGLNAPYALDPAYDLRPEFNSLNENLMVPAAGPHTYWS
jgi:hypothetical protein